MRLRSFDSTDARSTDSEPAPSLPRGQALTPRQVQVLRLVASYCDSQCYSPTIAELASEMGISRSTAFEHIAELQRKGLISACQGRARSLKLTCHGCELLEQTNARRSSHRRIETSTIPLLGHVAAGMPVEAIQNEGHLSLPDCFGTGGDLFALEVRGDSMIEEDIRPGDYVVCRRSSIASNGEIVVALVRDGQATLKRFYKEEDAIRLEPANPAYPAIETRDGRVEGVVVGLVRRL